MDLHMTAALIAGGAALGVLVWALAKLGQVLIKIAEALAGAGCHHGAGTTPTNGSSHARSW